VVFSMAEGPAWLTVDPQSGMLTGTPTVAGRTAVTLKAKNQHGGEHAQSLLINVR